MWRVSIDCQSAAHDSRLLMHFEAGYHSTPCPLKPLGLASLLESKPEMCYAGNPLSFQKGLASSDCFTSFGLDWTEKKKKAMKTTSQQVFLLVVILAIGAFSGVTSTESTLVEIPFNIRPNRPNEVGGALVSFPQFNSVQTPEDLNSDDPLLLAFLGRL